MTRKYDKKAEHWTKKSSLRDLADKSEASTKVQREKAALLKSLREAAGLSQTELGELVGKSHDGIYRLEAAKAKITPELEDLIASAIAERIEFSYIAGLIDRRCIFTIFKAEPKSYNCRKQTGYEARVIFNTSHKFIAELMVKVLGAGQVQPRKTNNKDKTHVGWCFQAFTKDAEVVLNKIQPYLKIKKPLADLMLDLRDVQNSLDSPKHKSNNEEFVAKQEAIFQKFHSKKDLLRG